MIASSLLLVALPIAAASPWAQPDDSPAHRLFKRQNATAPTTYPPALQVPPINTIPKEWLDKLAAVKDQIRKVPVSTPVNSTDSNAVTYPNGTAPIDGPEVCAFTTGCTTADDIHDGPAGTFLITFDDGPGDGTTMLSDFLESKNMSAHATHFMIGRSIVDDTAGFHKVFDRGGHIASHTWSHPRMTTLTDEQIVGELGWTMQAIADNSGGRLPLFWRPPYGDLDNRVRDIAKKVFGLETVLWNRDSNDWQIATKGKGPTEKEFDTWVAQDKKTGLNTLMHEINPKTVEIFMAKFEAFVTAGWKVQNVAEAYQKGMYFNAADNFATVKQMSINDLGPNGAATPSASAGADGAASPSGSSSASGSAGSAGTTAPVSKSSAKTIFAPLASVLLASVVAALF